VRSDSISIKFGILGTARIAPASFVAPAQNHPEVEVYAVASRDGQKAVAFGKKHGIPKTYGGENGYQGT
jgi:predicted dehydrogenase